MELKANAWDAFRRARDDRRKATAAQAASAVGRLTERDLALVGSAIYWCEGKKTKPWRPDDCRVLFTNMDVGLLSIFLRLLESEGFDRSQLTYRVSIHESGDPDLAQRWWIDQLGLPAGRFKRATLKRRRPTTNRLNTGADYHGCLIVDVPRSRELYWRIEGLIAAIREAANRFGVESLGALR